jgi:hypothetical protein
MADVPEESVKMPDMEMSPFDIIRTGEIDLEKELEHCYGSFHMVDAKPGVYHYKRYRLTVERGDILHSPKPPTPGWNLQLHHGATVVQDNAWAKGFSDAMRWFINTVESEIENADGRSAK